MDQLNNFGDTRQTFFCAHCASATDSRDHVPPKVFLDKPYPTNLPVVPSCDACNGGASMDEEYVACLFGCVEAGSIELHKIKREKIRLILERKPALFSRLRQACQRTLFNEELDFHIETERVKSVMLKLARGHTAFELNEPRLEEPSYMTFVPLALMSLAARRRFETPVEPLIWPEIGSRAMQRWMVQGANEWIIVQPERYRYLAAVGNGVVIRIVIGEYLGCEVRWN